MTTVNNDLATIWDHTVKHRKGKPKKVEQTCVDVRLPVVEGISVVGFVVVVAGAGATVVWINLLYVALNPCEVKVWSDLKRTTIVLKSEVRGFGNFGPQNLPETNYYLKVTVRK